MTSNVVRSARFWTWARPANPSRAVAVQLDELEFIAVPPTYAYWWSFGDGTTSTAQNPQHTYTNNGTCTVALFVSDGISTATSTTGIYVAPPSLSVSLSAANQVAVNWPAWASNYSLYSTTNLAPPAFWSPVTNARTTDSNSFHVSVPIDATVNRFFRLAIP